MGIKDSLDTASNVYVKENLLMVAINECMINNGWGMLEERFEPAEFFSYFKREGSNIKDISIKAQSMGNMLKVNFIGERDARSKFESILDSNIYEIPKVFNVNQYVSDDNKITNGQLLQNTVCLIIRELEEKLK